MRAVLWALLAVAVGCSAADPRPESPMMGHPGGPPLMSYREAYHFRDVGEIVATSVAVVIGTVAAVEPGRTLTYDGDDTLSYTNVSLVDVDHVSGRPLSGVVTIEIDELFTGYPGTPRPKWIEPGRTVLVFLTPAPGLADVYQPVNSQGVYRIADGTDLISAAHEDSDLSRDIASMTVKDARATIADVRARVDAGDIKAVPVGRPGIK